MKQTTLENIQQLNISTGGGISSEKIRIDTINHPVLVIGLGGTGTDALINLKYQVNRRFKLPEKQQKPANIEFLSLETNEHDKKRYRGITLDPATEVALLSNPGIGSILNNRSTLPEYIKSWLSPNLTITDGTKGASGNRQAGRLLLFEKLNTVIDAIENKIRNLRMDQENKLLVFILSGLSGGTGGGMFLDIAYIVRGIMEREYGAKGVDKVETMGYLFTPDVNLSGNNLNIHTEEYIQRNGYAALKELDFFMNIQERGQRFTQKYGTRLDVNSGLAPFNLCHLISATNLDGVMPKGAYDYCMNVTAENIVNFLALEEKENGQEFAIQDYYSNLLSNISTMKTNLPNHLPHMANFTYNIIGASAAVTPTGEINACLAHGIFKALAPMFNKIPELSHVTQFIKDAGLEISQLGARLALKPIKLDYAATDYYSHHNVIKTARVNIDEKLTQQYHAAKAEMQAIQISPDLKPTLLAHGPMFVSRLISSEINPCLVATFHSYIQELKAKAAATAEEIHALELGAETRLAEAQKAMFLTKESRKNAYIATKVSLYQARLQQDSYLALVEIYKGLIALLEAENQNIYQHYVTVLETVETVLAGNIEFLHQVQDSSHQKSYHWDIIDLTDTTDTLAEMAESLDLKAFTTMLLAESTRFLDPRKPDIAGAISDFVHDQFTTLQTKTMADYLALKYGSHRSTASIIETDIAPRLYKDAKPMFNLDNTSGIFNFPAYGMVSVPYNTPSILKGIENYQGSALQNLPFNIRKSSITNRIFWLNTQNGIPLFAYAPIKVYEELYERTIHTREGVGRHLQMTEAENWVNLPSPIPESLWGDTYANPRQAQLNASAHHIFKTALENGTIKLEHGQYCCKGQVIYPTNILAEAEAHFIRNPQLIALAKTGKTEEQIDLFLQVLTCDAIVKRGAHYIYEKELEDDPWPPFVNLIEEANYPEYAMFATFKNLPPHRQALLKAKAQANGAKFSSDKLLINLKKWQGKIALRKNQLDMDYNQKLYSFYKDALLRLNAQVAAIGG